MIYEERVYGVLVVSAAPKGTEYICGLLPSGSFYPVTVVPSVGDAKRAMLNSGFDMIIINTPLTDDFGTELALDVAENTAMGVLLLVKNEIYDDIYSRVSGAGALTLPKPATKQSLIQAIRLICATQERLRRLEKKNDSLREKMNEIRVVNRAKWALIEYLKMSEAEAHRYIEKQAMDMRISKLSAAEGIIRTYES